MLKYRVWKIYKSDCFEGLSHVNISDDFSAISPWIWLIIGHLMWPYISYILLKSHVNISSSFLIIKLFMSLLEMKQTSQPSRDGIG